MIEYDLYMNKRPRLPKWVVTEAQPHENYTISIRFADGSNKLFDMSNRLDCECFRPLKDIKLFMKARPKYDTVIWSDKIDIAPETLYDEGVDIK